MSLWLDAEVFGTRMVEPTFSSDFAGMLLAWRRTSGVVPNFEASEAMLTRAPVILCVVQVDRAWPHCARLMWNFSAFYFGSRICVWAPPMITGFLNCGLSALNSSIDISASWAAMARSMSLVLSTVVK